MLVLVLVLVVIVVVVATVARFRTHESAAMLDSLGGSAAGTFRSPALTRLDTTVNVCAVVCVPPPFFIVHVWSVCGVSCFPWYGTLTVVIPAPARQQQRGRADVQVRGTCPFPLE